MRSTVKVRVKNKTASSTVSVVIVGISGVGTAAQKK